MEKEKEELKIKKDQIQKGNKRMLRKRKVRNLKKMMSLMEMTMRKLAKEMTAIKEMIWLTNQ